MIRTLITATIFLLSMSSYAVTVTFDDIGPSISENPSTPYTEAGVTFTAPGGELGYDGTPGNIHLDDFGTPNANTVIVTTGSKFTPESIKIDGNEAIFIYQLFDPNAPDKDMIQGTVSAEGVLVRGFRGGKLVAEDRFSITEQPSYIFSSEFSKIDALEIVANVDREALEATIQAQYPNYVIMDITCEPDAPCSHFNIDSISINTAPKKPKCPRGKKPKQP